MKKDSVRYKISPHGKRKLDFPSKSVKQSVRLPLIGKTVYLDVKEIKHLRRLQQDLKTLGATIEEFVSKDINYLITSQPRPKTAKDAQGPGDSPAPSPFNCDPSPSPANIEEKRVETVTRGKALLEKARTKNRQTSTLLDNAEKWGVKIVSLEGAYKWIDKELRKLPRPSQHQKKSLRSKCVAKYKTIKTPYLKVENSTCQYRPFSHELEAWPHLNIDTPRGSCPFDGTQINRGSISHEERGEILPAQVDMPSAETPNEEKDAIDSNTTNQNNKDTTKAAKTGEVDASNILTAGELRRKREAKRRQERKRGYCECCRVKYEDLDKHVRDDSHREYVRTKSHYTTLDTLIHSGPSTTSFLQTYLLLAVKHVRKGTTQASAFSDEEKVLTSPIKPELRQSPRKKNKSSSARSPPIAQGVEEDSKSLPNVLKEKDALNKTLLDSTCLQKSKHEKSGKSPAVELKETISECVSKKTPSASTQEVTALEQCKQSASPGTAGKLLSPVKNRKRLGVKQDSPRKGDKENISTGCRGTSQLTVSPKRVESAQDTITVADGHCAESALPKTRQSARKVSLPEKENSHTVEDSNVVASDNKRISPSHAKDFVRSSRNTRDKVCDSNDKTKEVVQKVGTSTNLQDLINHGKKMTKLHRSSDDFEKCLAQEFDIVQNDVNKCTKKSVKKSDTSKHIESPEKVNKSQKRVKKVIPVVNQEVYSDIPSDFQCLSSTGEVLNFSKSLAERIKERRSDNRRTSIHSYNLHQMFNGTFKKFEKSNNKKHKRGLSLKKKVNLVEQNARSSATVASAKVLNKYKSRRLAKSVRSESMNCGYRGDDEQETRQVVTDKGAEEELDKGAKGSRRKKHWYYVTENVDTRDKPEKCLPRELRNLKDVSHDCRKPLNESKVRTKEDSDSDTKSETTSKITVGKCPSEDCDSQKGRGKPSKGNRFWTFVKHVDSEDDEEANENLPYELRALKASYNKFVTTDEDEHPVVRTGRRSRHSLSLVQKVGDTEIQLALEKKAIPNKNHKNSIGDEPSDNTSTFESSCTETVGKKRAKYQSVKSKHWDYVVESAESDDNVEHLRALPKALRILKSSWNQLNDVDRKYSSSEPEVEENRVNKAKNSRSVIVNKSNTDDVGNTKSKKGSNKYWEFVIETAESDDDEHLKALPKELRILKSSWNPLNNVSTCSSSEAEIEDTRINKPRKSRPGNLCESNMESSKENTTVTKPTNAAERTVLEREGKSRAGSTDQGRRRYYNIPVVSPEIMTEKQKVAEVEHRELAMLKDAWADLSIQQSAGRRRESCSRQNFHSDSETITVKKKNLDKKLDHKKAQRLTFGGAGPSHSHASKAKNVCRAKKKAVHRKEGVKKTNDAAESNEIRKLRDRWGQLPETKDGDRKQKHIRKTYVYSESDSDVCESIEDVSKNNAVESNEVRKLRDRWGQLPEKKDGDRKQNHRRKMYVYSESDSDVCESIEDVSKNNAVESNEVRKLRDRWGQLPEKKDGDRKQNHRRKMYVYSESDSDVCESIEDVSKNNAVESNEVRKLRDRWGQLPEKKDGDRKQNHRGKMYVYSESDSDVCESIEDVSKNNAAESNEVRKLRDRLGQLPEKKDGDRKQNHRRKMYVYSESDSDVCESIEDVSKNNAAESNEVRKLRDRLGQLPEKKDGDRKQNHRRKICVYSESDSDVCESIEDVSKNNAAESNEVRKLRDRWGQLPEKKAGDRKRSHGRKSYVYSESDSDETGDRKRSHGRKSYVYSESDSDETESLEDDSDSDSVVGLQNENDTAVAIESKRRNQVFAGRPRNNCVNSGSKTRKQLDDNSKHGCELVKLQTNTEEIVCSKKVAKNNKKDDTELQKGPTCFKKVAKDNEKVSIELEKEDECRNVESTKTKSRRQYWDYIVEPVIEKEMIVDPSLPKELRALLQDPAQSWSNSDSEQGRRRKSRVRTISLECGSSSHETGSKAKKASNIYSHSAQDQVPLGKSDKKSNQQIHESEGHINATEANVDKRYEEMGYSSQKSICTGISEKQGKLDSKSVGFEALDSNQPKNSPSTPSKKRKRDCDDDVASMSPVFKSIKKSQMDIKKATVKCYFKAEKLKSPNAKLHNKIKAMQGPQKEGEPTTETDMTCKDSNTGIVTTPIKERLAFTPESGYSGQTRDSKRKQWKRKKSSSPLKNKSSSVSPKKEKKRKLERLKFDIVAVEQGKTKKHSKENKPQQEQQFALGQTDNKDDYSSVKVSSEGNSENFLLKWEPVNVSNIADKREPANVLDAADKHMVKLNKSWSLLSDRSVGKLLSSDDEGSFEGFQEDEGEKLDKSLRSDLSFEECNEVVVDNDSEHEWIVGETNDVQGIESPVKFDTYAMFSSPAKPSESSWMDACDLYIDKSLNRSHGASVNKSHVSGCRSGVSNTSPWRSPRKSLFSGSYRPVVTPTKHSSPVVCRLNNRDIESTLVERVDQEIEFNFGSPQKDKSNYSPLQVRNGHVIDSSSPRRCLNVTSTPSSVSRKLVKKKKHVNGYDGLVFSGDESWCSDVEKSNKSEFRLLKKVSTVPKNFQLKYDASPQKQSKKKKKIIQ